MSDPDASEPAEVTLVALRTRVDWLCRGVAFLAVCQLLLVIDALLGWIAGWGWVVAVMLLIALSVYIGVSGSPLARAGRSLAASTASRFGTRRSDQT